MNGNWQIFISDTTPTSLGNGVRFHYNPKTNKLQYRDPETGEWTEFPYIDFSPYLTKLSAAATYLTQNDASTIYLNQVDANTVYLTKQEASETYISQDQIEEPGDAFLTENNAALIYLSKSDAQSIYATLNSPIFTGNVVLPSTTNIGTVSATEISRLSGVSGSIQQQLDKKLEITIVESSTNISLQNGDILYADTSDDGFVVSLPEEPVAGYRVTIIDVPKAFYRNPLEIKGAAAETAGDTFVVTNNGSSAYVVNSQNNPTLNLIRGLTYTFNINATGHPFYIQETTGSGYDMNAVYSDGVTGNGTESGTLEFVVPNDAPDTLYYQCEFHSSMAGIINITDPADGDIQYAPIEGKQESFFLNVDGAAIVLMYINDTIGWKVV